MTAPTDTGAGAGPAAQYVYGVTRADSDLPGELTGLDGRPVTLIAHQDCAALTSDLPAGRPLGERSDLLAHQHVLEALLEAGTVAVPFRFGAALAGPEAVEKELLAANADRLTQILDQLDGRLEMRVRGTYVQDAVLRELLTDDPQIADLNARLRQIPEDAADAAYYDRVRLGEMIAHALEQRREHDAQALLEPLAGAAEATVRKQPAREDDVVDAAFLIDAARREHFENTVRELGAAHADRITLRLIGPLPPYDFVPEA
ncbi:GvpL/GvpF family gas vesicle protein [Actinomadura rugatobispora]|uniref:GvpL/GvpF family gas vesicle protein n=1 Tax=Actinomadura rugatobispora TaxID=1994 RepID=A0ABW1A071_9ACTN|nr:GvpL/GvpF family gas vesicle protein [Actinomadura rugatobispora]